MSRRSGRPATPGSRRWVWVGHRPMLRFRAVGDAPAMHRRYEGTQRADDAAMTRLRWLDWPPHGWASRCWCRPVPRAWSVGMDHVPGTAARAELTSTADDAATAQLDEAQVQARRPRRRCRRARRPCAGGAGEPRRAGPRDRADVRRRGSRARCRDPRPRAAVQAELREVPGVTGPESVLTTSAAVRDRHAAMLEALEVTEGLDDAWVNLTTGSLAAARLSRLLADHDRIMGEAVARRPGRRLRRRHREDRRGGRAPRRGRHDARPAREHRRRLDPRRVDQAQRGVRGGAARPVPGGRRVRTAPRRTGSATRSPPNARRAAICRRTRGAWS